MKPCSKNKISLCILYLLWTTVLPAVGYSQQQSTVETAGEFTGQPQQNEEETYNVFVDHLPIAQAKRGKDVEISVDVTQDWHIKELVLIYRKIGDKKFKKVNFSISSSGNYVALVKGEYVTYPGFEYAVWVKEKGKKGRFAFASGSQPHPVIVHKLNWKEKRRLRLMGYRWTTSTFFADYAYTWFGKQEEINSLTGDVEAEALDIFHRFEFGYSYRILTILHSFYFGIGVVRGLTLKHREQQLVGIDYGFSRILFEFHRFIALEPKIILGGSEEGFEWGGGAVVRFGNTLETHVDFGFEIMTTVGNIVFLKFIWDTVPGFQMGLNAELTDFPSSTAWGTRLYVEANYIADKYLHTRIILGYATRSSKSGGIVAGLSVNLNF